MRLLAFAALAACSAPTESAPAAAPAAAAPHPEASARYLLRWDGVPMGRADISLRRIAGGYRMRRHDWFVVLRDGVRVETRTALLIDTDGELRARRVRLTSQVGPLRSEVAATRDAGGWTIARPGGEKSRVGGELEIADVAELAIEPAQRVPVLLPGAGFARLELSARARRGGGRELVLDSPLGAIHTTVAPGADGLPAAWRSDSGESGERLAAAMPAIEPAELLELAAMPGGGRPSRRLRVRGAGRPPPAPIAGQRVRRDGGDWIVELSEPPPIPAELAALTREVGERVADDLSLPGLDGDEALGMGRGDCTGHAAALVVLARRHGYRARLATGYRRRGRLWLRHRWTVVELGGRWVSLDPSFGEAPPPPGRLLALEVHGEGADEIAVADLVAFRGMAAATARFE